MAQRSHKSVHIQSAILQLIPRLAAITFDGEPAHFPSLYLSQAVTYVLSNVKRDRQQTFFAVGYLATAVGDAILPQLPKIMDFLRTTLRPKDGTTKKKSAPPDDAAYICLCMLARSVAAEDLSAKFLPVQIYFKNGMKNQSNIRKDQIFFEKIIFKD
jgi:serine/threonine-protein kinase mTOR